MLQYKYLSRKWMKPSTRNLPRPPWILSLFYSFPSVTLCLSQVPVNTNAFFPDSSSIAVLCVIQTISTFITTFAFGSGGERNSYFALSTEIFYFRVRHSLPGSCPHFLAGLESVPLWNAYVGCPPLPKAAWNLKGTTYFFSHTNECN